ncbi:hypothetical protein EFY87_18905 [Flexivirga caeni]|uniref:Uncharacterized protein n=1 Tax=Flexivirga caeni TaxID=2294115 RepID=A0A3M9M048_9MICO|nr:hypothetical protein EFY87_18905 [Flexivirga caeni]
MFGDTVEHQAEKPRETAHLRVLITVKAAPNPSLAYGETVCVAGVRLGALGPTGWIRLYPINFRHLPAATEQFKKYDIVTVECTPAGEARFESWRPNMSTLHVESSLPAWRRRQELLDPIIDDSMCCLRRNAAADATARSLALVRPAEILGFRLEHHPGWSKDEQSKIDGYVNQLGFEVFEEVQDKTPLEAPRFRGFYRWRCADPECGTHEQSIIDWEFVALQQHLHDRSDADAQAAIRTRFFEEMCAPDRQVAFYVGNQAKRPQTFSILGVYYPKKGS